MMHTGETSEALAVAKWVTQGGSALTGGEYDPGKSVTDASTPRTYGGSTRQREVIGSMKVPRGYVRRDILEAIRIAADAADRLAIASRDVDRPGMAVAAHDLSQCLATMWHYREFGDKPWQQIVQLCQQVLCEPDEFEDIRLEQSVAIQSVVRDYVSQRFARPGERREALRILRDAGFDVFRLVSGVAQPQSEDK